MAVHTARTPFDLSKRCISGKSLFKGKVGDGRIPKRKIRSKLSLGNPVSHASARVNLMLVTPAFLAFSWTRSTAGEYTSMA